jgi:hypothetical protein
MSGAGGVGAQLVEHPLIDKVTFTGMILLDRYKADFAQIRCRKCSHRTESNARGCGYGEECLA